MGSGLHFDVGCRTGHSLYIDGGDPVGDAALTNALHSQGEDAGWL